MSGGDKKAIVY